jgi:hypothetical protein
MRRRIDVRAGDVSRRSMPGRLLDDVEMDAVAVGALHRPIFGTTAAGDDPQHGELRVAVRATGTNGIDRMFKGRLGHNCDLRSRDVAIGALSAAVPQLHSFR